MRERDCVDLLQQLLPRLGLQWSGYRRVHGTVCKRIRRRIRALGLGDLDAYRRRVLADPAERVELDAMCRIPISRFGRDRAVFEALATRVLPMLAERRPEGGIRCWSCSCASGEEPYSLQILWRLQGGTTPVHTTATDADAGMLERAKAGCYGRGSLKELTTSEIARAFQTSGDLFCVRPEFRESITFLRQDVRAELPEGRFDLILCRNLVFTYFEPGLQRQVLRRIKTRLMPGGFLVLGHRERLPEAAHAFQRVAPDMPVWRRPDSRLSRPRSDSSGSNSWYGRRT